MNSKKEILTQFSKGTNFVLSTSENEKVTSRTISVIVVDDAFYFTSVKRESSVKNKQIASNPNVALCSNTIQMTGKATVLGLASDESNTQIMSVYKEILPESYKMFIEQNECLVIKIDIDSYKNWKIVDGAMQVTALEF